MNTSSYWHQTANKWVSAAVLAGGLVSALLLVFVQHVQSSALASSLDAGSYSDTIGQ